ncbi:PTS lactose/cellobiose transporter subunit IIA [Clostridium sp. CTA-5]
MEEVILNLIMHSGEARSYSMEAISLAKEGEIIEAKKLIKKADKELGYAHNSQTTLIQTEASGQKSDFSLLLVHAEDHLMTTIMLKDLSVEFIELYERIDRL